MRRKNDFYPTEYKLTEGLLEKIGSYISGTIFEPCNGEGHITRILSKYYTHITINDITNGFDATNPNHWTEYDWVITNPPFKFALPILKNALKFARKGVIFLTRLSFLEPTYDRSEFFEKYTPDLLIINPRTSFTGDGKTDSVTTVWVCYGDFPEQKAIQFIKK